MFQFRIEAGDETLRDHVENAAGNAKYTSVRTQNELISICEDVVREDICEDVVREDICEDVVREDTVSAASAPAGFSILADERADISGEQQLSLGVRFVDTTNKEPAIHDDFLGFISLAQIDAETTANTLIFQCTKFGLDLTKLVVNDRNSVAEVRKVFYERAPKDAAWYQMSPYYVKHFGWPSTKASEYSPTTS